MQPANLNFHPHGLSSRILTNLNYPLPDLDLGLYGKKMMEFSLLNIKLRARIDSPNVIYVSSPPSLEQFIIHQPLKHSLIIYKYHKQQSHPTNHHQQHSKCSPSLLFSASSTIKMLALHPIPLGLKLHEADHLQEPLPSRAAVASRLYNIGGPGARGSRLASLEQSHF